MLIVPVTNALSPKGSKVTVRDVSQDDARPILDQGYTFFVLLFFFNPVSKCRHLGLADLFRPLYFHVHLGLEGVCGLEGGG